MRYLRRRVGVLLLMGLAAVISPARVTADPVPVRFAEGVVHGCKNPPDTHVWILGGAGVEEVISACRQSSTQGPARFSL